MITLGTVVHPSASLASAPKFESPTSQVGSDDDLDAYVGTGGLLLPATFSGGSQTRVRVASCLDCIWKYSVYCAQDSPVVCAHAITTCPLGKIRYRVIFGTSPDSLETVGSVCWGSSKPLTRQDVERSLQQTGLRYVPAIRAGYSPPSGAITGLPVFVWSGQPQLFRPSPLRLSGQIVTIAATPKWCWKWGDGQLSWTASPGATFPSGSVFHAYRASGTYNIVLTTVWDAEFTVRGVGTFPVSGPPITQNESMWVKIWPSKTLLAH